MMWVFWVFITMFDVHSNPNEPNINRLDVASKYSFLSKEDCMKHHEDALMSVRNSNSEIQINVSEACESETTE